MRILLTLLLVVLPLLVCPGQDYSQPEGGFNRPTNSPGSQFRLDLQGGSNWVVGRRPLASRVNAGPSRVQPGAFVGLGVVLDSRRRIAALLGADLLLDRTEIRDYEVSRNSSGGIGRFFNPAADRVRSGTLDIDELWLNWRAALLIRARTLRIEPGISLSLPLMLRHNYTFTQTTRALNDPNGIGRVELNEPLVNQSSARINQSLRASHFAADLALRYMVTDRLDLRLGYQLGLTFSVPTVEERNEPVEQSRHRITLGAVYTLHYFGRD